ncbi:hypothetical protein PO124_09310 [Bacillus licheniformis]|nr:hypothetical protein [Bacillus licheniformis]
MFASPASLVVEQLGDNYHEAPILGFRSSTNTALSSFRKRRPFSRTV